MITYFLIFAISCAVLAFAGKVLVQALSRLAEFLGWKEFTVSFFVMSAATALPEFFVGVSSAVRGVPELSFGNIIGQSIIHFTVAVGICAVLAGSFSVSSAAVRASAWFSGAMAILPIILIADGVLSRLDGIALILSFVLYSYWLLSSKNKFGNALYTNNKLPDQRSTIVKFKSLLADLGLFAVGAAALLLAAQGIISSTVWFSGELGLSLVVVGAIIVGLGTSLPEIYFSAMSAKEHHAGLMLGNLLGSTAVSVSMVLGAVALINPIVVPDMSPYLISRAFLVSAVILFIMFMYTGRRITVKEGVALFVTYLLFLAAEMIAGV